MFRKPSKSRAEKAEQSELDSPPPAGSVFSSEAEQSELDSPLPAGSVFSSARARVESLSRRDRLALVADLNQAYRCPEFLETLHTIRRRNSDQGVTFNEQMSQLLRSAHQKVLSAHGLPEGEEGELVLAYAVSLGNTNNDPEAKKQVERADGLLHGPISSDPIAIKRRLTKREILDIMRSQIVGFSKRDFQDKLRTLMHKQKSQSEHEARGSHRTAGQLPAGVDVLALSKQGPILDRYCLQPDRHGMQELTVQLAPYVMDPTVATCITVANALLGMDEAANAAFLDRLRVMCCETMRRPKSFSRMGA